MDIQLTEKDFRIIDEALNNYITTGKTNMRCPYCGKELLYKEFGSSYTIECGTDNCLKEEFRGI